MTTNLHLICYVHIHISIEYFEMNNLKSLNVLRCVTDDQRQSRISLLTKKKKCQLHFEEVMMIQMGVHYIL